MSGDQDRVGVSDECLLCGHYIFHQLGKRHGGLFRWHPIIQQGLFHRLTIKARKGNEALTRNVVFRIRMRNVR